MAPMTAIAIDPMKPSVLIPSKRNRNPHSNAPMTPIIKLPATPKPFPCIILPDSQPASNPIK